ncbi:MAG: hypothetical protein ABH863_05965 [Candidatus Micrarchaeota archaeon]
MPDEPKQEFTEKDLAELFEKAGKLGAVLALLHFDSYGKDKENVRASLVELVSRINAEKGVIYCRGEVEEVLETEDEAGKSYTTYTEIKVMFSNFDIAIGTCLKYGPLAVEIIEPNELRMNQEQMQNTLLNASSISQQFTNYFMSKLLKKEDLEEFQKNLEKRVEHGKELMKKRDGDASAQAPPANATGKES